MAAALSRVYAGLCRRDRLTSKECPFWLDSLFCASTEERAQLSKQYAALYSKPSMILYYKMYITRVLIGRNPCLDQAIQTRMLLLFKLPPLGNVARIKKSGQNHSPSARVSLAFLNSRNIPACLDQAIQTRKP